MNVAKLLLPPSGSLVPLLFSYSENMKKGDRGTAIKWNQAEELRTVPRTKILRGHPVPLYTQTNRVKARIQGTRDPSKL